MDNTPIRKLPGTLDEQAADLYRHYGARPWDELPEATRDHFRGLISEGIDGAGRPLTG